MDRVRVWLAAGGILVAVLAFVLVFLPVIIPPGSSGTSPAGNGTRLFVADPATGNQYVSDTVIVRYNRSRFTSDTGMDAAIAGAADRIGGTVRGDLGGPSLPGLFLVQLPASLNVTDAIAACAKDPDVLYAEPDFRVITMESTRDLLPAGTSSLQGSAETIPDDPEFPGQYYLHNTGQDVLGASGTPGADINATAAWTITTGSDTVIVGIIDTGINTSAPDLAGNLWTDPVTGANGSNFTGGADNSGVMDTEGHGTQIASVLGAVTNNSLGGAGVTWHVRMMALKVFETGGVETTTTSDVIRAIRFGDTHGASVSCIAWISAVKSRALQDVMATSPQLFVAAAGNLGTSNDKTPYYPAAYSLPNLITVAATDQNDRLASFSNYGPDSVDIAAPGTNILVYACDNAGNSTGACGYYHADGTSMAVPQAAGVAVLAKAANPSLTAPELKTILRDSADVLPSLAGRVNTSGRLDAYRAVFAAQGT